MARSIIGQCADCCTCPTPTVQWDSRPASKSKCGFPEWAGYVSSPPKRYLRASVSGSYSSGQTYDCGDVVTRTETYSGDLDYDSQTCATSGSVTAAVVQYSCDGETCVCEETFSDDVSLGLAFDPCGAPFNSFSGTCTTISSTQKKREAGSGVNFQNTYTTLSLEYDTALLKTNTVAALPAYDDDWNDTAGSFANLSTDELSYAIRESRYRFRFKVPKVGQGCYRISWKERFTPEGGGAATDTERCVTWDGTVPEGYDPDDAGTWPILPASGYYEIPIPSADGTTTVVDVVGECTCEECPA